jgi:hypothetical protein
LTPIYFDKAGDGRDEERNSSTKGLSSRIVAVVFILTGISFLIAIYTHNDIFRYFFQNIEYVSVSYLFPWLILSGGIFACGQALTLEMMSRMHMSSLATVKIGTSIFGILMNILFCLNAFLVFIRCLLVFGIRTSYTEVGFWFWLSPLADPVAVIRIWISALTKPKSWRGRTYT